MTQEVHDDLLGAAESNTFDVPPPPPPLKITEEEKAKAIHKGRVAFRSWLLQNIPGMGYWEQDGLWQEADEWVESWKRLRESVRESE